MYQNLPEEGLLVQKITVTENAVENIPAAGEESQVAEKNENPIDEMNVLRRKDRKERQGNFRKSNTGGKYRGCSKTEESLYCLA